MSLIPVRKKYTIKSEYIVERKLPKGLKIEVDKGASVTRDTIIASGEILEEKARIDIPERLSIDVSESSKHVETLNGEMVMRGDIIARKKSSFSGYTVVRAPCRGVIKLDEINKGFLNE